MSLPPYYMWASTGIRHASWRWGRACMTCLETHVLLSDGRGVLADFDALIGDAMTHWNEECAGMPGYGKSSSWPKVQLIHSIEVSLVFVNPSCKQRPDTR